MNELKNIEKKIKGYGFDSLCLRYNIARDAQAEHEAFGRGGHGDIDRARKIAQRDKMRFYEILDEMIGEHD